ncbi:MAG: response regulator transcription factor [Clostridia bacterium]|nr:response regulator transcription factor [Clostridia bacterium]
MERILIVEDDAVIAGEIARHLGRWDMEPVVAEDFSDVLGTFRRAEPRLVLLDISLPRFNGFYWCERIRAESKTPIIFLSSRQESMDIVMAVNMGGDDYIVKPVAMDVLMAKIQAMLRRSYDYETAPGLRLGPWRFDAASLSLRGDGGQVDLTRNEARILQTLLSSRGAVVSREKLMLALWDSDAFVDDNTLTVNVNRLRRTLRTAGLEGCIETHKGLGYSLRA